MTTTENPFAAFAARHGLTLAATAVPFRFPARKADEARDKKASHFAVTIYGPLDTPTGARPVLWQGCYSVGAAYPLIWAKREARERALRGFISARVLALRDMPARETVAEAELRDKIVRLYRERARLEISDVLESLQCDARCALDSTFDDWCADMGMDTDSRSALEAFEACRATARSIRAGLGADVFDTFMTIEA